jgi:hypothetical protein
VVYGNKQFGGLGYAHLHTEKCIQQIESLITHIRANTTLGKSFVTNLEWCQLVAGSSTHILQSTYDINYIDSNWILDVRDFLIQTKSNMSIPGTWAPQLYRTNDRNLMDTLVTKSIPKKHLRIFNNWRIYFQVIRLSDMTNARGDKLDQKYVQYNASTNHSNQTSRLQWPRQDKPNKKSFAIWKKILQQHFSVETTGRLSGYNLGSWLIDHHDMDRKWQYFSNTQTLELFESDRTGIIR